MKTCIQFFCAASRSLILATVAGIFLAGMAAQGATLTSPTSAPTSPGNVAPTSAPSPTPAPLAADQDIRDIRPPYHLPPNWRWLAWTAGGLALLALGYGAWRWRHRLGLRVKLPYEIALEQLEAARKLMQPDQAREFSITVSEIVRVYIEKNFRVRAAHHTTEEFLHNLATRPDSPMMAHQPVLADFLQHCDMAKFARWILSVPQMETMLQSASVFVVATGKPVAGNASGRPIGTPPEPPASGSPENGPVPSKLAAVSSATATLNPQTL